MKKKLFKLSSLFLGLSLLFSANTFANVNSLGLENYSISESNKNIVTQEIKENLNFYSLSKKFNLEKEDEINKKINYSSQVDKKLLEKFKEYQSLFKKNHAWFELDKPLPRINKNNNNIEVSFYFVYSCQACYNTDTVLLGIQKKINDSTGIFENFKNVSIYKQPFSFILKENEKENNVYPHLQDAKLFFALKELFYGYDFKFNIINNDLLFNINKNKMSFGGEEFLKFLDKYQISDKNFYNTFYTIDMENMALMNNKLIEDSGIASLKSIPLIIVNGKYAILSHTLNMQDKYLLEKLIEHLILLAKFDS